MSQLEATAHLSLTNIAIGVPSEEALAEGADPKLELGLVVGLPVEAFRSAQGEPLQIPLGTIGLDFTKEEGEKFAKAILEAIDHLPDTKKTGDVLVANNMAAVEAAAQDIRKITGKS